MRNQMLCIHKIINYWAVLGRLGYAEKLKQEQQRELDEKFGENQWQIGHLIEEELVSQDEVLKLFEKSYQQYFEKNPEILDWLCLTAKDVYDTNLSNIHSGLDYTIQETKQTHLHDVAIRRVLKKLGRKFQGNKYIQIRGEEGEGFVLTTGQVPFYNPALILTPQIRGRWNKNSIESFWQSNKVLTVKFEKLVAITSDIVGIILRSDLNMGKGKFSTQAAHVAVTLLPERGWLWSQEKSPIEIWVIKTEESLESLYRTALKNKNNCCIIRDAGKTQLSPGTKTAIGIGPINQAEFDRLMCEFTATPLDVSNRNYCTFKSFTLTSY